ncbi:MAG: STAS domain-containing protein [Gemmataceae bacterium]
MALLIFSRPLGPALVFDLHGALDSATAEKLQPRIDQALADGHKVLIFDLHRLTFISSPGLSLFLGVFRRLRDSGSIRFVGLTPHVRRVFDITGMTALLELYGSVEDALVGPVPNA